MSAVALPSSPLRMLRPLFAATLVAIAAFGLSGCEDEVTPTIGLDSPFSLYGYLDPTADLQAIRVVAIADRIDPEGALDATVTSTDLETGVVTTWRDSLVTYDDGTTGNVFVANYTPRPGSRIKVVAATSDGITSEVETDIPPFTVPRVGPGENTLGDVLFPVRFSNVPRVLNGQLRLTVRGAGETTELRVPVRATPEDLGNGDWGVTVPLVSTARAYLQREGLLGQLQLLDVTYVGFVANQAWNAPSDDPETLAEPGTFSNVTSGLGFVGGGYFAGVSWLPAPAVQVSAGFRTEGDVGASVALNEVMLGAGGWLELYNPLDFDVNLTGYSLTDDQTQPFKQVLPLGTVVQGRGYFVVELTAFSVEASEALSLYTAAGTLVSSLPILHDVQAGENGVTPSYGSFPDGLTFKLPQNGPDIYRGALTSTRGGPNELGLSPAAINEIYTEGATGWVEARTLASNVTISGIMSDPEAFFERRRAQPNPSDTSFLVADEFPDALALPQSAGTVFLVAEHNDTRIVGPSRTLRIVDVRTYTPQTPGRSSGYLPDAPSGSIWQTGSLTPTRGAPNASARVGS